MPERLFLAIVITLSLALFIGVRPPASSPRSLTHSHQPTITASNILGLDWIQP
jgi:hypothetical protein